METPVKYQDRLGPDPDRVVTDDIDALCDVYEQNDVHLVRVGHMPDDTDLERGGTPSQHRSDRCHGTAPNPDRGLRPADLASYLRHAARQRPRQTE